MKIFGHISKRGEGDWKNKNGQIIISFSNIDIEIQIGKIIFPFIRINNEMKSFFKWFFNRNSQFIKESVHNNL